MQITPVITIHLSAALGAEMTGPVALWANRGATHRIHLQKLIEKVKLAFTQKNAASYQYGSNS